MLVPAKRREVVSVDIPTTTSSDALHQALAALGVPREVWRDVISLQIKNGTWRVKIARRHPTGELYTTRFSGEPRVGVESYDIKVLPAEVQSE